MLSILVGPQLVLRPQLLTAETKTSTVFDAESGFDAEHIDHKFAYTEEEKDSKCEDEDSREYPRRILSTLDELKDPVQGYGDKLNSICPQKFDKSNASNMTPLEENNRLP